MSIVTNGDTTTIDSSESAAAIASATLASNIIITQDAGTPPGDPVIVDLSALANVAALSSITVQDGATGIIGSGLIGVGAATAINLNGGLLEVDDTLASVGALNTGNVGPNGGEIKIDSAPLTLGLLNVPVNFTNGVPANFKLDFPDSSSIAAVYDPTTGTTTIGDGISVLGVLGIGRTITLTGNVFNIPENQSGQYAMTFTAAGGYGDGSGGILTCFLPGTGIETPAGEIAVENIRIGDEVVAILDGVRVGRRVVWVGSQHVEISEVANPEDYCPVRITKDALAGGVPQRDLLVTPEHCLFFDGKLIPARMLVNGRSILSERTMTSFDFHHVETAEHSILVANGALSESYLDTGNRTRFTQPGSVVVHFSGAPKSWAHHAAAPLAVDSATVQPVWAGLNRRAQSMGLPSPLMTLERVTDPDLHLQTDTGAEIRPVMFDGRIYAFVVPAGTQRIRLLSRASRPSDTIGPFMDDRRHLGVLVGAIGISDGIQRRTMATHLSNATLDGWHAIDTGADRRWTDGSAILPLDLHGNPERPIFLDIEVVTLGAYLVTGSTQDEESRMSASAAA